MFSKTVKSLCIGLFLSSGLLWATGPWKPGDGIQSTLTAADWSAEKGHLLACNTKKAPYHFSKRTTEFDHEVRLLTPFAKTAEFLRENKKRVDALTFEEASKVFNPPVLVVVIRTKCVDQKKAGNVLVTLKTESGTIQPVGDKFTRATFEKIGYYGQWYHFVEREFTFDLAQVSKAKSLTVCVIEAADKTREIDVDLINLR